MILIVTRVNAFGNNFIGICNGGCSALVYSLCTLNRVELVTAAVLVMIELCITGSQERKLVIVGIS